MMIKEGMWKNAILIIAVCFIVISACFVVVLILTDIGLFTLVQVQGNRINGLISQNELQETGFDAFVAKLQMCKAMDDVDRVLKTINVKRIE